MRRILRKATNNRLFLACMFIVMGLIFPTLLLFRKNREKGRKNYNIFAFNLPKFVEDKEKLDDIRNETLFAWNKYKETCWGAGELGVFSKGCTTVFYGLTMIDSLPTLYNMGLYDEFNESRDFLRDKYVMYGSWSTFEITIRILGGFISAYQLSHDKVFLDKSIELGDAIYSVFNQTTGEFPHDICIYPANGTTKAMIVNYGYNSLAEMGSIQLEFASLTKETGDPKYLDMAMKFYHQVWGSAPDYGLISSVHPPNNKTVVATFGAHGDSYYEYIIKLYIMTGCVSPKILDRYLMVVEEMKEECVFESKRLNITGIGKKTSRGVRMVVEHLQTFVGGMVAIGAVNGNPHASDDLNFAAKLVKGYYDTYQYFPGGIAPDLIEFNENNMSADPIKVIDDEYKMRPETVESIYVMWKLTGEQKYRDYAWKIFQSLKKYCRTENGYSGIADVRRPDKWKGLVQESYFLAETLHYLYLTFESSDFLTPDQWVFNTEAHPLQVWDNETAHKYRDYLLFDEIPFHHKIVYM